MSIPEPDAAWIERLRRGDAAAAGEFLDRFGPPVLTFLARFVGSRTDADDLFQDLCVRVVQALPAYAHAGRFRGWLFAIAANAARDHLRKRAGDARMRREAGPPGTARSAEDVAAARESLDRLREAVGRLPETQREVFLLRMHSGLTFREIADLQDAPLNTVLGRMHDAVERLRQDVGDSGHDL